MGILYLLTGKVSRSLPTVVSGEGNFVSATERQQTHQLEPLVLRNELKTTEYRTTFDDGIRKTYWSEIEKTESFIVIKISCRFEFVA